MPEDVSLHLPVDVGHVDDLTGAETGKLLLEAGTDQLRLSGEEKKRMRIESFSIQEDA